MSDGKSNPGFRLTLNAVAADDALLADTWTALSRLGVDVHRPAPEEMSLSGDDVLLTVWSSHSLLSEPVVARAAVAQKENRLLPVRTEDIDPPIGFRQIQTISMLDHGIDDAQAIVRSLKGLGQPDEVRRTAPTWFDLTVNGLIFFLVGLLAMVPAVLLTRYIAQVQGFNIPPLGYIFTLGLQGLFMMIYSVLWRSPMVWRSRNAAKASRLKSYDFGADILMQALPVITLLGSFAASSLIDVRLNGKVEAQIAMALMHIGAALSALAARKSLAAVMQKGLS